MIKVFYDSSAHRLTVSGHAGTAPKGEDLLCAGATALALTLASNVELLQERGAVTDADITLEDGAADISCKPASGYGAVAAIVYDTICLGFAEMATANPEHMEFRRK